MFLKESDHAPEMVVVPVAQDYRIKRKEVRPNAKSDWINFGTDDFDKLIPIASKDTKSAKSQHQEHAIFSLFSLGISTNRDEWVYGEFGPEILTKVNFFRDVFEREQQRWINSGRPKPIADFIDRAIKWTAELEKHLEGGSVIKVDEARIFESQYRPFVRRKTYFGKILTHRSYQQTLFFPEAGVKNTVISISIARRAPFALISTTALPNTDMFVPDVGQCFARYRFKSASQRIDNITDWAFDQFRAHYEGDADEQDAAKGRRGSKKAPTPDFSPQGGEEILLRIVPRRILAGRSQG